jgi:predicted dehydrogenase
VTEHATPAAVDVPLRWALIGAGAVARSHAASLAESPAAVLVGVVDPDLERAKAVAAEFDVAAHGDLDSLLVDGPVHAATVAVPNHLHVVACDQLLDRGIAPLVEKPLAPDLAGAVHILQAAERAGRPVGAILNMRYLAPIRAIADACHDGALRPRTITMRGELARRAPGTWRTEAGGGLLLEVGVHYLDLLQWWLGTPDDVEVAPDGLGTEHVDVTLRWADTTARLHLDATAETGRPVEVDVDAAEGAVQVIAGEITRSTIADLDARTSALAAALPCPAEPLAYGPGHLGAIRSAADELVRHDRFPVAGREAMAAIALCEHLSGAA